MSIADVPMMKTRKVNPHKKDFDKMNLNDGMMMNIDDQASKLNAFLI